jgi:hypothetical protein
LLASYGWLNGNGSDKAIIFMGHHLHGAHVFETAQGKHQAQEVAGTSA